MDELKVRTDPGNKEDIRKYALEHGWESLNSFMLSCIDYVIAQKLDNETVKSGILHPKK